MPLTNPNKVVTEERLNEYHKTILPYLGGNSMVACGGGYAPIGTVIAYMGTTAPSDFLICDGTVYNIADYTELADFFEAQFGSANFFGGDGNTTFAVPDLRGEFLRGTGTNSHANQGSGANVGVHQDGTAIPKYGILSNGQLITMTYSSTNSYITNADSSYSNGTLTNSSRTITGDAPWSQSGANMLTSRPTNTSVLYCIKAKSQGNGYSLDEQIVGTWIDGKPIYQKTVTGNAAFDNSSAATLATISDIDSIVSASGMIKCANLDKRAVPNIASSIEQNGTDVKFYCNSDSMYGKPVTITLQYTKTTD